MIALVFILFLILSFVIFVRWLFLRMRFERMEQQIADLAARVRSLEKSEPPVEPVRAAPKPVSPTVAVSAPPRVSEPPRPARAPAPVPPPSFGVKPAMQSRPASPDIQPRSASPSLGQRLRKHLGDAEWEALVGGSLLNKIGALVLVIGIALFLGYSFTHLTPAGRALTSLGVSFALLAGGIVLERRQTYRIFARGLIGAGWAALYVTAYAVYAIPTARLISNPVSGSLLLLTVAVGMIAHSLSYRVQAITAVAYFAAFAALGVTPWSVFAVVSMIPLSASLLYLAHRFRWNAMAVFGVLATCGTCIWRGSPGASLMAAQSLLLVYWILFETFDLLRARRGVSGGGLAFVFPSNAIGFLALSYAAWIHQRPAELWQGYAFAAALYLISAVTRYFTVSVSTIQETDVRARAAAGSFEAPVTLAALLAGLAIAGRLTGVWLGAGLAIEAEILYLGGVFLNAAFLRWLGSAGFVCSLLRLLAHDVASDENLRISARPVHAWVPRAVFHAALFYLNRIVRQPNVIFSSLATALVAAVLADTLPERLIGPGWLVYAAILFEFGLRRNAREFRIQSYALAIGGIALAAWAHLSLAWQHSWIPSASGLAFVYALFFRARRHPALSGMERTWLARGIAPAIAAMSILLVLRLSPHTYRGALVCLLAVALFELALRRLPSTLAAYSFFAAAAGSLLVVVDHAHSYTKLASMNVSLSYAGASLCLYALNERCGERWQRIRPLLSSVAIVFALCTIWLLVPDAVVGALWAVLAVALFYLGQQRADINAQWPSYAVMLAALAQAWSSDFHLPSIVVAAACFAAQFLSPREDKARTFWALLGTFTISALLWVHFPGGWLTTAWGIEGLALLAAGFPLRERILRLSGLAPLLVCISKLFVYDLRNLETVYRILSFVALGLILLGVSSIYTRFRERVKRIL